MDYKNINILNISELEAKELIKSLSKDLNIHNKAYYEEDNPLISDAKYDYLLNLLKLLEENFPAFSSNKSPVVQIGFAPSQKFSKITHKVPMLSLSNGFTNEDILDFIKRVKSFFNIDYFPEFFCEAKIDGLSFSAYYENGILKTGSTRGDGYIGEDITTNLKNIEAFPLKIHTELNKLEVRGEIYIDLPDFESLNKKQAEAGLQKFANPRNAAAGSLRQLDANITKNRSLKYFIYAIGEASSPLAKTQKALLEKLSSFGFKINDLGKLAKNENDIFDFYEALSTSRNNLSYEIDGAVYKLNDFSWQHRMGFIARSPRHSIAHKFPAIIGLTKLNNITLQVGRTGTVTPIAELEPLALKGVTITRATLHNFQEIERKDIRLGDYVLLQRAGDVIPQITGVDYDKRANDVQKFILPKHCPSCYSILEYSDQDILIRCTNGLNCPAQNIEVLYHFVTKEALNIIGLGRKQIKMLIDNNLIRNQVDIFKLSEHNNLNDLERLGEKSVNNLLTNIEAAKQVTLSKFIYALGIRHVGQEAAKLLAKEFVTIDNLIASITLLINDDTSIYQKLDNINGIGKKVLTALIDFFKSERNFQMVKELKNILNITAYTSVAPINNVLNNKNIVFTGNLNAYSRTEAKIIAEKLGAKVSAAVSSSTDFVVAGENAGSKLKKAQNLGVSIINEEEWTQYINN